MRIEGLDARVVAVPFREQELWAFGGRRGLTTVILEMRTDEGIVGLGEAPGYPSVDIVGAVLRSLDPLVVGEDPFRIERLLRRIEIVGTWHHVKATSTAIAAVEMACWDVLGKVSGQPLVNLFGGRVRDRVPYFWYLPRKTPEETAAAARAGQDRGFRTFYLKVGWGDPGTDVALVEAVRDAVGPDARIRVDANEAWSPGTAIRVLRSMEPFDIELAEQPVSGRNLSEMTYVRSRLGMPLLANEASWTQHDVLEVIRHGAADVLSLDNQMMGGLLNMKRAAGMCETAGLPVLKHSLAELGIGTYAALHLMASTANFLFANQSYASLLTDDVLEGTGSLPYTDGTLEVPTAPGIGVTLDRDKLARYAELYREEGQDFGFHDPAALADTPTLPKL